MKKQRKTLPKLFEANPNLAEMRGAEIHGRMLTVPEYVCDILLASHYGLKECGKKMDTNRRSDLAANRKDSAEALSAWIVNAVLEKNWSEIQTVATFVKQWDLWAQPKDRLRWKILLLKQYCKKHGTWPTAAQMAKYLKYSKSEDGYSALRVICKKLKFPLAPDKRGAPKKSNK